MAIQLAAAVTSFVICFLIIPVIIKYSLEKNLVDIPGRRKIHKKITPSMGGIAIFIGFVLSALIWTDISQWKDMRFILIALFMVFFIGVRDDLVPLRAFMKLLGQIVAAIVLIALFDLRLKSLYGLVGIYDIPLSVSYMITLFTIIVITNSFNLIDGLDGLAGTIAGIALLSFGVSFYLVGERGVDHLRPVGGEERPVDAEGRLRDDDLVARAEQGEGEGLQHVVESGPDQHLLRLGADVGGEGFAKGAGVELRVAVDLERVAQRLPGLRRGAVGRLVPVEPDVAGRGAGRRRLARVGRQPEDRGPDEALGLEDRVARGDPGQRRTLRGGGAADWREV